MWINKRNIIMKRFLIGFACVNILKLHLRMNSFILFPKFFCCPEQKLKHFPMGKAVFVTQKFFVEVQSCIRQSRKMSRYVGLKNVFAMNLNRTL